MTRIAVSLLAVLLFALPSTGVSRTWYVKVDQTGDAPTIQAAIDSAGMDDTILVGPGTYSWSNQGTGNDYGMIRMLRGAPALTIASEMGPEMTILDGEFLGRIFFFQGYYPGTPGGLTMDGFTFVNGDATFLPQNPVGGAFTAHLSSPIVRNCVFRNNTAVQGGALWYGGQGSPTIVDCLFDGNMATYGGAVLAVNTPFTVTISRCHIQNSGATRGGAVYGYNVPLVMEDCVIARGGATTDGGGMIVNQCYPSVVSRCTFYGNFAPSGGGISVVGGTELTVDRLIIAGSLDGGAAALDGTSTMTFSCSDLFGNIGGDWTGSIAGQDGVNGNFSADPLFCHPSSFDLTIEVGSPCAPGNHPDGADCGQIGALPPRCGDVPVEKRSWGAIKSMFAD